MFSKAQLVTLITIRDMNRAIKFYTKSLGAKIIYRGEGPMRDFWASLKIAGTEVWLISPQRREKRALAYSTFVVKNIRSTVARLKQNGVRFQRAERMSAETRVEGPISYESMGASAFFKDSEGNVLMLWQAPRPR